MTLIEAAHGRRALAANWQRLGGLASAAYVVAGVVLFPGIGAVVTVGLFIAGQALASLLLDSTGLLGVATRSPGLFTWCRSSCSDARRRHPAARVHRRTAMT